MDTYRVNAITCDVEDYFQVSAFGNIIDFDDWCRLECRIPRNVDAILQLFSETDTKGTFFILGWVAQHHPEVVRNIAEEGHEIASHGMRHTRVWQQSRDEFFEDASASRKLLQDVSGCDVKGYRAASWSVDKRTPWAHDALAAAGYSYSSSIYPVSHDHYGVPDAPRTPYVAGDSGLTEIPASTVRAFGRNIPAGGGGFFRLFPLRLSKHLIDRYVESLSSPYMFYFHPWELDPDQPRVRGASLRARFRHYLNLRSFERRIKDLLRTYRWGRMDAVFLVGRQ